MPAARKTDKQIRAHFRSNRFTQESGKWFFYTREGTLEGPYDCMLDARIKLEVYINVVESGLLPEFAPL